MRTILFQAILVYLNHLNGTFQSKVEKQWWESISLFQTIPNWKHLRQILTHPDSAVRLVRHIFISLTSFLGIQNSMRILYKASLLTDS